MSVYIDPTQPCLKNRQWRYDESCHLFADTLDELHAFAKGIGLKRSWFQGGRRGKLPHYDLTRGVRVRAVGNGAVELTMREAVVKWIEIRGPRSAKEPPC